MIPDAYYKDIYSINYKKLKKLGYKYLFFDLDNTLIKYYCDEIDNDLIEFISNLKKDFKVYLFSNSRKKKVKRYSELLKIDFYSFAKKPLKVSYKKIKNVFDNEKCIFIGDQFMTDVIGAKRRKMSITDSVISS